MLLQPVFPVNRFVARLNSMRGILPIAVSEASTGCKNHNPDNLVVSFAGAGAWASGVSFFASWVLSATGNLLLGELQDSTSILIKVNGLIPVLPEKIMPGQAIADYGI